MQKFRTPVDYRETSQDWQTEIDQMRQVDPDLRISSVNNPQHILGSELTLETILFSLLRVSSGTNLPEVHFQYDDRDSFLVVCRIACEQFLSRTCMAYVPRGINQHLRASPIHNSSSSTAIPEDMLTGTQDSAQSTMRSSSPRLDAPTSSYASTPASTAASGATQIKTESTKDRPNTSLLQTVAGCSSPRAQMKIQYPSPWIVGGDPSETAFSVNINTEVTEGMRRRAKQEAREVRKRKRAETLLQLQREHNLLPATQPMPNMNFYTQGSQPATEFSSQPRVFSSAPPIAMSQPVAGAFGGRSDFERPKKKPKRKGGF